MILWDPTNKCSKKGMLTKQITTKACTFGISYLHHDLDGSSLVLCSFSQQTQLQVYQYIWMDWNVWHGTFTEVPTLTHGLWVCWICQSNLDLCVGIPGNWQGPLCLHPWQGMYNISRFAKHASASESSLNRSSQEEASTWLVQGLC